ncbi:DUF6625 family protein [Vibrio gigantis]|uniref:Uncharacterized protein n=1 Tax=Vibrio gigantis TaxID=296199 RepID=A0A5M9NKH6_9VIBR|nr:DUF6625 family protein [Vibrio gigantis]KAA8671172.1 hypothetical protein F4W18_16715 [Vibrio gigantis]
MKTLLIIPYIGKLNIDSLESLKSLLKNSFIDVLLLTDDEDFLTTKLESNNLKTTYINLQAIDELLLKKLNVGVSLKNPYKLCDFRPFFWLVFQDFFDIADYDYIGHCDLDVLYGNLYPYFHSDSNSLLPNVIGANGHFCVYDRKVRELLSSKLANRDINRIVSMIFSSNKCFAFDEFKFFHVLLKHFVARNQVKWDKSISNDCVDLSYYNEYLYCNNRKDYMLEFNIKQGEIISKFQRGGHIEVPYVHFQKRRMSNQVNSTFCSKKVTRLRSYQYTARVLLKRIKAKLFIESTLRKFIYSKRFTRLL